MQTECMNGNGDAKNDEDHARYVGEAPRNNPGNASEDLVRSLFGVGHDYVLSSQIWNFLVLEHMPGQTEICAD